MVKRLLVPALVLGAFFVAVEGQAGTASGHPVLLIGIDGAEWSVIKDLWSKGQLPNFKALADRGVSAPLATQFGQSPVIWTTVATGMRPEVHGITGFVVATDDGDVPISSTMRKVPALWNIATDAGLRTNVIGWWGAWPAEPVSGVNVTEKAQYEQPGTVYPAARTAEVKAALPTLNSQYAAMFPGDSEFAPEDRVTAWFAPKLAAEGYDLQVMYLHGSDPNSHKYWRYYRPQDFPNEKIDPAQLKKHADKIPQAYRAIDEVIGWVVQASSPEVNVIIVSDHGFHPLDRTTTKVTMDMDMVLEQLGYLKQQNGKIDFAQTKVYTYGTRTSEKDKRLRFNVKGRDPGGVVNAADVASLKTQVMLDLGRYTYKGSGRPVFMVSEPAKNDAERGADLVVRVLDDGPSKTLLLDGATPLQGAVRGMVENSGGHSGDPPGVFLAAGPDIDKNAKLQGISVLDITPTVLYGLGLPVAKDFAGKAWTNLYTGAYQSKVPLKTVPTYGTRKSTGPTESADQDEMLQQLRELGYIE